MEANILKKREVKQKMLEIYTHKGKADQNACLCRIRPSPQNAPVKDGQPQVMQK
jgi:hypothetical protein